jgi:hypothetical protein
MCSKGPNGHPIIRDKGTPDPSSNHRRRETKGASTVGSPNRQERRMSKVPYFSSDQLDSALIYQRAALFFLPASESRPIQHVLSFLLFEQHKNLLFRFPARNQRSGAFSISSSSSPTNSNTCE